MCLSMGVEIVTEEVKITFGNCVPSGTDCVIALL